MTSEGKNAKIAKWAGWQFVEPDPTQPGYRRSGYWKHADHSVTRKSPPDYANSLDACAEFERLLNERGGYTDYVWNLIEQDRKVEIFPSNIQQAWALVRATAAQRCHALLNVIGESDG